MVRAAYWVNLWLIQMRVNNLLADTGGCSHERERSPLVPRQNHFAVEAPGRQRPHRLLRRRLPRRLRALRPEHPGQHGCHKRARVAHRDAEQAQAPRLLCQAGRAEAAGDGPQVRHRDEEGYFGDC